MKSVLIVNESMQMKDTLRMTIRLAGLWAAEVSNGHEGLVLTSTWNFSLIILNMNAFDTHKLLLARKLRLRRPDTPIMVLAEFNSSNVNREIAGAEISALLEKPTTAHVLRFRVLELLADKQKHRSDMHSAGTPAERIHDSSMDSVR